jgi:PIN domain nuclease of toxin-antitoxin system
VADAIARGTTISSVNLAEVLAITADRAWGAIAADVAVRLTLIR